MSALSFSNVSFGYGNTLVLDQLSFALKAGELCCLLGPSGCGKSTALRLSAGFMRPLSGEIAINGQVVASASKLVPPETRNLGMVFQDFALFPHLTARANVAFGLHRLPPKEAARRTESALERVAMQAFADRYPHELSGGQQQRVALARALAPEPKLLLLDEPFSSLDTRMRSTLAREVRDLLRDREIAALLVTHDQDEAFAFADEVGVLRAGRLEQWGSPFELYHRPQSRFVAEFVGEGVLIRGQWVSPGQVETALGRFSTEDLPETGVIDVLLRPDDFELADDGHAFVVVDQSFRGADTLHRLRLGELEVLALLPSHHEVAIGGQLKLRAAPTHVVVFQRAA